MPAPNQNVTLLVLTSQAGDAERLIASLRNGGLPVRGMYTAHAGRIDELVERRACDLIVCLSYDPAVDLEGVLARHRELDADVPLIVVADHHSDPQAMLKALRAGARDVTERDDAEHLQLVVGRELSDLRQRRQARRLGRRLQQCEQRARELIETTGEAIAFLQDGMHVYANPAYLDLFRFATLHDLQASPFLDLIDPQQRQGVRDFLHERESSEQPGRAELRVAALRSDGSPVRGTLGAAPSEIDGEPCLRVLVRETEDQPPLPGISDLATAVPGSQAGFAALMAEIGARLGPDGAAVRPFALLYIRVRTAPQLIREHGLYRGLTLVAALGAGLARLCGDRGILARINDDGFALLAEGLDEPATEALAERIRLEVRLPRGRASKTRGEADCEVGFVLSEDTASGAPELLDAAFLASQGAGPRGRKGGALPKPTSLAARTKQAAQDGDSDMTAKIEQALAKDRFILVYQPIVSLMGDNQENYTVLLRMLDEDERLLEAQDFIEPAIRSGLIERIDKWAIRHAIEALGEHRRAGHNLNFFINLAEDSFRDPGVIIWICDCLRELNVRGSWLTFVFQEELVDANLGSLNRLAESLKKIKCRVAVNRFGATDHPQMLLQALSLDFVLLRPEYAQGLADDKGKQQQLLALANLAREFNVKSVVTGVEDARSLTILWTAGVDYVQGNFLQRPSPTLEIST